MWTPSSRGRTRPPALLHGSSGPSAAALAIIAEMTAAPSAGRQTAISTLVDALQASGVWDKLDHLYVMAAHTAQAAKLDWKNPAGTPLTDVVLVDFTTDVGLGVGVATNPSISCGYTPASLVQFTQDACHIGARIQAGDATLQASTNYLWGNASSVTNPDQRLNLRRDAVTNLVESNLNTDGGFETWNGVWANGYFLFVRESSAPGDITFYHDGADQGAQDASTSTATTALSTNTTSMELLSWGNLEADVSIRLSFAHLGGLLTTGQAASTDAAFDAYLAAL